MRRRQTVTGIEDKETKRTKYIKKVRESVTLPPAPTLVVSGAQDVQKFVHSCASCGKEFESSIRKAFILRCWNCWRGTPAKPTGVLKYNIKGVKWKKIKV